MICIFRLNIFKSKLSVTICLVLLFSLALSIGYSIWSQERLIQHMEKEQVQLLESQVQQAMSAATDKGQAIVAMFATNPEVVQAFAEGNRDRLSQSLVPVFLELKKQGVEQIQFHKAPAVTWLRLHMPKKFGDDLSSFRHTVVKANKDKTMVSGLEEGVGGYGFRVVTPIMYQSQHIGSVEVGYNLDVLFLQKELKQRAGGDFFFYGLNKDKKGNDLPDLLAGSVEKDLFPVSNDMVGRVMKEGRSQSTYSINKQNLVVLVPIKDYSGTVKGYIKAIHDRSDLLMLSRSQMLWSIVGGFVVLVIALSFILVVMERQLIRPISQLMVKMESFAAGDLTVSFATTQNGDIARISKALERTLVFMRKLVQDITSTSAVVKDLANHLTDAATLNGQASEEVASAVQSVAEGASVQAQSAVDMASSIQELAGYNDTVQQETTKFVSHVSQSANVVQQGYLALTSLVNVVAEITRANQVTIDESALLSKMSTEIGVIVNSIREIASQTNLLALNAAIEAARAGEAGKGFAVVAEEVRRLADQSSVATKQIESLISAIQGQIGSLTTNMNKASVCIQESGEAVSMMTNDFGLIRSSIDGMGSFIGTVEMSVHNSTVAVQGVEKAIVVINDISRHNAAVSQEVSASSEELTSSMQEIVNSSGKLTALAENLHATIANFKL